MRLPIKNKHKTKEIKEINPKHPSFTLLNHSSKNLKEKTPILLCFQMKPTKKKSKLSLDKLKQMKKKALDVEIGIEMKNKPSQKGEEIER